MVQRFKVDTYIQYEHYYADFGNTCPSAEFKMIHHAAGMWVKYSTYRDVVAQMQKQIDKLQRIVSRLEQQSDEACKSTLK